MLLQHQSWPEVESYLEQCQGIIVPIGSTEQHGPNGLIGTDSIVAETIAREAGLRAHAMVAPTISVGMAEHHMAFKGSMTLRADTLGALLEDYISSLVRHGFTNLYFINGHGGNVRTLSAVLKAKNNDMTATTCKFLNWWMGRRAKAIREELYGPDEGMHATPSEISITWHAYPEQIRAPLQNHNHRKGIERWRNAEHYRELYPDGCIGSDPSLATKEAGAKLLDASAADVAEDFKKFLSS